MATSPDEPTLADGHWHGQEWQFHIATDIVVVKNGNFTLLLTSINQEWEFHIAAGNLWSRMANWHGYLHLAVKNG